MRKVVQEGPADTQPLLRDSVAVAILLLAITAVFADVLFLGSSLSGGDLPQYHFPMKKVVREIVLSGHFPLWNRLLEAGQPIAANPAYEVFYPPQWLILLPSFVFGFKLHILLHYYLAALGMYALTRALRMQAAAALIAAATFALGGPLMSMNAYLPFLFSMAWLPWILFFAWRHHRDGRRTDLVLAAVAVSMQCFVGEPTILLQSAVLLIIGAALARRTGVAIAILIAGAAIGAVQLIPLIDHARDSVRSIPLDYSQVSRWSAAIARPAELFVGSLSEKARRFVGPGRPFIPSIYLGLPIAVFALAGFASRLRFRLAAALTFLGFYIVAIGQHTPLLHLLYSARLFSSVRYPEKFLFGALFVVVLFGAYAIDAALSDPERLRRLSIGITCTLLVISVISAAITSTAFIRMTWLLPVNANPATLVPTDRAEWLGAALRAALLLALLAAFRLRTARLLLPIFAVVDVVALTAALPVRTPDRFYAEPPPLVAQTPPPEYRIYHQLGIERTLTRVRPIVGVQRVATWVARNEMLPNFPMAWNRATVLGNDTDETMLLPSRRLRAAFEIAARQHNPSYPLTFMAMSNAPFTVVARDFPTAAREAGGDLEKLTTARVVRAPIRADRYAFASRLVPCSDLDDCVARLRGAETDVALVPSAVPPMPIAPGFIVRVEERPSSTDVDVRASGTAFLKISVTFHKYWHAMIDGRPVQIVPTNFAYQGVFVPAGAHRVHLAYRNPLIAVGGAITLLTLVLLGVYAATSRPRAPIGA